LPHAHLTVQDWPLILPIARTYAAQLGVADRVDELAGDLRTVEFGDSYDAVFLGHILHNYAEETGLEIVRKCLNALAPGGVVAIIEFLAEPGQTASIFSWLFSAMIRGTTPWGAAFPPQSYGQYSWSVAHSARTLGEGYQWDLSWGIEHKET
jgi:SAM-dependent methyltransferase